MSLRFCQRMDDFPVYSRRPSCDTLALAMCDPGLRRRHSSECEEDSLPEIYMDSGLSTLRGSHGGYDSELEVKGQEEEDGGQRVKKKLKSGTRDSGMGETCDVEVRGSPRVAMSAPRYPGTRAHVAGFFGPVCSSQPAEMQDAESAFGSDSSSVLEWKSAEPVDVASAPAPKKPLTALRVQVRNPSCFHSWGSGAKHSGVFLCSSEGGHGQQHRPGLHDIGEGLQDRPGRRRRCGKVQLPAPSLQERIQSHLQRHPG